MFICTIDSNVNYYMYFHLFINNFDPNFHISENLESMSLATYLCAIEYK